MISSHFAGHGSGLSPEREVVFRLTVVLAAYAVLALAGKRRWLRPQEVLWIGLAEIFWAFAWLIAPVLIAVRSHIPDRTRGVLLSVGMVLPVLAAMGVGLRFVIRAATAQPGEPSKPMEAKRKRRRAL